ncbi:hypothetical protein C2S53_012085 [Perilla frutescens var. hirtella]|uniref:Uncharacterized protein n=1 Tax=Perilla frutescens var. hirtella TaxID=608512 RepID=A0AAD4PBZ4_PERFH|nr:hypothetical protein C2S53_012085 [Perilla frutescens var. hirtella]
MAVDHISAPESLFLDALYCEDEKWAEFEEESKSEISLTKNYKSIFKHSILPPLVFKYDFCWEWDDEELQSLFSRERETSLKSNITRFSSFLFLARKQAVEFIFSISSYHGFSASATILAVNFLDRFMFDYANNFDKDKPWLMQLVAVASLSLAAKVEETHVPLLVDLQVEDAKYLFEAKTIQRMELLILSALKWRMNSVTPLSFIDHIVRRLGLKSHVIHLEFLRSCENLILSVISDSRLLGYFPSVLATATMLHVVHQDECCANLIECENTMLDVLKISKKEVDDCYGLILDVVSSRSNNNPSKRKKMEFNGSSGRVIIDDDAGTNSYTSNDSSEVESSSSSPRLHPIFKKARVEPHQINH